MSQHTHQVVFGRRDPNCPRCSALSAGAPAIKGWGWQRRQDDARRIREIRAHDCKQAGCGPVCTFGDW